MRRVGVVTFPGSNCDADVRNAVDGVSGLEAVALWHKDADLNQVDAIVIPGGFSYGDYLRCGAIARFSPIMGAVAKFAASGGPVLGICNGFQILCEAGLLPGVLMRNRDLSFLCRDVYVRSERATPFSAPSSKVMRLPIAHGEGNWQADAATLAHVEGNGQVVFRYVSPQGDATAEFCPNGAQANIAGVSNTAGNVVGLMPHPERVMEPLHGGTDGRSFFTGLLEVRR